MLASERTHTNDDFCLEGVPIPLSRLRLLTSEQFARMVGKQQPGGALECASGYDWKLVELPTADLMSSTEDDELSKEEWVAKYRRQLESDRQAVGSGSPEYAGRDAWIRQWILRSDTYPLFVVAEQQEYRLWDGHHRLAGAVFHGAQKVWVLLGVRPG